MTAIRSVLTAHSVNPSSYEALYEIAHALRADKADFVILFVSSRFPSEEIEKALRQLFSCPVYGCTTAGEVGARGITSGGISGISFLGGNTRVCATVLPTDCDLLAQNGEALLSPVREFLRKDRTRLFRQISHMGILLVDGLSVGEERVLETIGRELPGLMIVGGSAGDDSEFKSTSVIIDGVYRSGVAALLTIASDLVLFPFKTQHFMASEKILYPTRVSEERRLLFELDGVPAAMRYAQIVGLKLGELGAQIFSQNPFVHLEEDDPFVVAVKGVGDDLSLSLYSSVNEGLPLRIGRSLDFITALESAFATTKECVVMPQAIITFECILRRIELDQRHIADQAGRIYAANHAVGFHTYGEQFGLRHINQSLAGLVIGTNE